MISIAQPCPTVTTHSCELPRVVELGGACSELGDPVRVRLFMASDSCDFSVIPANASLITAGMHRPTTAKHSQRFTHSTQRDGAIRSRLLAMTGKIDNLSGTR